MLAIPAISAMKKALSAVKVKSKKEESKIVSNLEQKAANTQEGETSIKGTLSKVALILLAV